MKYLGIVLLVLSGYVMAEEVYYCSDNTNGHNGFNNKDGQYKAQLFTESKFKMKLQDDENIKIENDLYICSTPYGGRFPEDKNKKSCVHELLNGWFFNFNQDNGRYVKLSGSGYVFFGNDSVSTHIGTCTKF